MPDRQIRAYPKDGMVVIQADAPFKNIRVRLSAAEARRLRDALTYMCRFLDLGRGYYCGPQEAPDAS